MFKRELRGHLFIWGNRNASGQLYQIKWLLQMRGENDDVVKYLFENGILLCLQLFATVQILGCGNGDAKQRAQRMVQCHWLCCDSNPNPWRPTEIATEVSNRERRLFICFEISLIRLIQSLPAPFNAFFQTRMLGLALQCKELFTRLVFEITTVHLALFMG